MPELPEVETMCRGIAPLVGRKIVAAGRLPCQRRPIAVTPGPAGWKSRVVGQKIDRIDRVGKRVVIVLSNQERIVFEPRMTGLVLMAEPPSIEHLRFHVDVSTRKEPLQLRFWDRRGLGSVRLYSAQEFESAFQSGKIGPDALAVSPAQLKECFAGCRQSIKPALLDQKRLAGVGNLYASELLFSAGVHPAIRCHRLTDKQWKAIHKTMLKVLRTAIRYEGSTLGDGTYRNALNKAGGYQNKHRVYNREGLPCPVCTTPIQRFVQTQRATFYCPNCQADALGQLEEPTSWES
ncbi:MAG: bifunctional DNA-formamidopyrimidine glycosylase/DNA-(apurinic or apyrimidinic site) lyase [Pirellulaceae bacterium]|nr:bifunctional DNA-formamidopyrimidine glycosylase/DNA-(apurinic or apyrimidinic site) lyase [Pirellulaceae bacterium]